MDLGACDRGDHFAVREAPYLDRLADAAGQVHAAGGDHGQRVHLATAVVQVEEHSQALAVLHVPQTNGAVPGAAREPLRSDELEGGDGARVAAQRAHALATVQVPDGDDLVAGARGELVARHRPDGEYPILVGHGAHEPEQRQGHRTPVPVVVGQECARAHAVRRVPDLEGLVGRAADDALVGDKLEGVDGAGVADQGAHALARVHVPRANGEVAGAARQERVIDLHERVDGTRMADKCADALALGGRVAAQTPDLDLGVARAARQPAAGQVLDHED